jgi:DNA-binding GntR family transcriptional regulator
MLANLTKAEAVYRETRWRILTGALRPGTPVNQAELASEFQMSPTPVREALRRLESEGLVIFVAHTMVTISPLDLKELDDLYVIRVALDPLAGRLAAINRTTDDVARLKDLLDPPVTVSTTTGSFTAPCSELRATNSSPGTSTSCGTGPSGTGSCW